LGLSQRLSPFWESVAAAATAVAVIASPDKKNDDDYPEKVVIVEKIAKTIHGVSSFID